MSEEFQRHLVRARQEQILDAAIVEIAEHGFQRTTIKQIAARAGVADGTIYNYFKNKDDILLGIMARLTEAEGREAAFAEAANLPFERFVTLYLAHRMAEVEEGFPVFKALLPETIVNESLGRALNEQLYQPLFTIAEAYFQRLMEQGKMDEMDPQLAVRLFASPMFGLMMLRLLGDQHVAAHWDHYTEALIALLLRLFDAERPPTDPPS